MLYCDFCWRLIRPIRSVVVFPVFALCGILILEKGFFESVSRADEISGGFRFVSPATEEKNRWRVEGDKAVFIDQNTIEISPVRATVATPEGEDMTIKMPWARLNRTTKDVWSDASIEIMKGKSRLTGVGLRWNTQEKKVQILKNARLEIAAEELNTWKDF